MTLLLLNSEGAHRSLYRAHWALVSAVDHVHAVIMEMHSRERYRDERETLAPLIENLRGVREKINEALHEAGGVRVALIQKTGCDGSCEREESPHD